MYRVDTRKFQLPHGKWISRSRTTQEKTAINRHNNAVKDWKTARRLAEIKGQPFHEPEPQLGVDIVSSFYEQDDKVIDGLPAEFHQEVEMRGLFNQKLGVI